MSTSSNNSSNTDQEIEGLINEENASLLEEISKNSKNDKKRPTLISFNSRLAQVNLKASNLILEAAKPLLRILTNIPKNVTQNEVAHFRNVLEDEIEIFYRICEHLSLKREHLITARYCICTALDEAINQTDWGGGNEHGIGLWPKESLLSTFHKDSYGGDKLFLLVGKLSAHPTEHIDAIELVYYLLELGFEGRYRYDPNGKRQLDMIKSRLFNIITSEKQNTAFELSPHWEALNQNTLKKTNWHLPIWLVFSVAIVVLIVQFIWYQFTLNAQASELNTQIIEIGNIPFKPQKTNYTKLKLKQLLQAEIDKQILTVSENDDFDLVSFKGDGMFASGKTNVNPSLEPIFERIVSEVKKLPNMDITVTGHSDNIPIRSNEFKDNEALSKARAQAVADLLQKYGYPGNLIITIGKGSSIAIDTNDTAEGRAKNRRVELLVKYPQASAVNQLVQEQPASLLNVPEQETNNQINK